MWIYKHVNFVLMWLDRMECSFIHSFISHSEIQIRQPTLWIWNKSKHNSMNDNTVVINNFCFQYVNLVNNTHRMSCKLKRFKILWWHFKHWLLKLYMNDTTWTHSTNGLNILELHHSHVIFNVILTGSNYAILHFWLLSFCGLCPSSSIPSRKHFGNCSCFHPLKKKAEIRPPCSV